MYRFALIIFAAFPVFTKIVQDIGVSNEDIAAIRETWQIVYENKDAGILLFKVLFEMYPDYEKYFVRFKTEGQKSLFDNPRFIEHVKNRVINALNNIIVNLENDEILVQFLETVGNNHKRRNLRKEQFTNIGKAVIETLRRALRCKFTPEVEEAWTKVINKAMETIGNVTG